MGYAINYTSVAPLATDVANAIQQEAIQICNAHTWLSCEPLFLSDDGTGRLSGISKPTFEPDVDDAAAAAAEGLPDGTVVDLLNALCKLSKNHGVDWEVGDDFEPIGLIRNGRPDDSLATRIHALDEFANVAAEFTDEMPLEGPEDSELESHTDNDQDDDFPPTLKLFTE